MNAFEWANAKSADDAVKLLTPGAAADFDETHRPIGGGQDLHTTMKAYIQRPSRVVNLKTISGFDRIVFDEKAGLTLGATATLTDIAEHHDVKSFAPGLVQAIESVASPQIRNVGTLGGNLCQRPRCWYFRLDDVKCLKRGGDTCYAKEGENKYNAVFGTDAPCVITHPSDLAPMLVAMDADIGVVGPRGSRTIKAGEFYRMPTADDPRRETVLAADEIVTHVHLAVPKMQSWPKYPSTYLKFKERSSLDFAMASVAIVADLSPKNYCASARVVLGGVAPIPWPLPQVEAKLKGKPLDSDTINAAAAVATEGIKPLSQNGYKAHLIPNLVRRALFALQ